MPMLLVGLGIGALASQLGAVTVSAVPDDQSPEVGGVQNTMTNLGASLGTAPGRSLLIATLTSSFLTNVQQSQAIPASAKEQAQVELAGGIPFISDADLETALEEAGASSEATEQPSTPTQTLGSTASARHSRSSPCSPSLPCSWPRPSRRDRRESREESEMCRWPPTRIADPDGGTARQERPLADRPEPARAAGCDYERRRLRRRLVRGGRAAEGLPQHAPGAERRAICASSRPGSPRRSSSPTSGPRPGRRSRRPTRIRSATATGSGCTTA